MTSVGDLRERVTFQAYDAGTSAYVTVGTGDVWARVAQPPGQVTTRGAGGTVRRRYDVTARYTAAIEGSAARILWRGKTLEIIETANPDEHRNYLTFGCRESLASALSREIDQRGISITLRRAVNGSPADATKPWNPGTVSNTDVATKALIDSYTIEQWTAVPMLMGKTKVTLVLASDDAITQPLPGDRIVYGSRTLVVEMVERVSPMDPVLAYTLTCRE